MMNSFGSGGARMRWTRVRNTILFSAFLYISAAHIAIAQDPEKPIRIDTELATFEVLVEDQNGKPVHGLKAEDFRIFENGKPKKIDFFQPVLSDVGKRPMVIVFAVDVSGSMTPAEIERLRNAIVAFMDRFADHESYFSLVSFAMNVKTLQKFTNRPEVLKKSLEKLDRDRDGLSTHAFDATDLAVRMISRSIPKTLRGREPKRAVVLITDGFPVGDTVSPSAVIDRANAAGTTVYSIILPSYSPIQRDTRPLMTILEASGLMERTGGSSFHAVDNDLEPLFKKLAGEITASYAIAYYPDELPEGTRKVLIESRKGLRVKQSRTSFELKKEK
jgi:Ca-activated chloride channel family protein